MPTVECLIGELRGKMETLENQMIERAAEVDQKFETISDKIDTLIAKDNQNVGAMWAFSKIGALAAGGATIIGWVSIHGFPAWLKRMVDG